MEEYAYELKIPQERVAVLIGTDGKVKKELESQANATIEVDSEDGDVRLKGQDSIALFQLKDVIKAIGRGFNPEVATRLFKQDFAFELLSITDYVKKKNHIMRLKGRLIGKNGKARESIEELTETSVSVYGKTVGVVGPYDRVAVSKKALEMLLSGSPHSSVFKMLEKQHKQWKMEEKIDI